jgi:hypothetical protein
MLIAGSCSADVILGSISDGYTYSSFDANNVVISFGSVAPSGILEFEWLFASGDATDTSGNSNDGTIIGMVNVPLTNGLASHFDMANATNSMSATMGNGVESICWWGNSNGTWRYYESIGGTQRVNNATEAYTASDWFTTNGTAFNFGGSAFDIAQARGYNTVIDNVVSTTNRVELGSNLGIISDYLASNTNTYWQDTALYVGFNNIAQDGSPNNHGITTASAGVPSGTVNYGYEGFDGNTQQELVGSSFINPSVGNITYSFMVSLPDTYQGGAFIADGGNNNNGFSIGVGGATFDAPGNNLIGVFDGVGGGWIDTDINIGTNWHHIVVTIPSNTWMQPIFYLDGTNAYNSTLEQTINSPSASCAIGGHTPTGGFPRYPTCKMRDVMILTNRVWSAGEVGAYYTSITNIIDELNNE